MNLADLLRVENQKLQAECRAYRKALLFYATKANWRKRRGVTPAHADGGHIAASILARIDRPSVGLFKNVNTALDLARRYSQTDGAHHKAWVIDQMVRALTGDDYAAFVAKHNDGEDGPNTYAWDVGIAP